MVEEGRLGRKTNAGWYRYSDGKKSADPEVEAIVLEQARAAGVSRRSFTTEEIQVRLVHAMIDEGARILDEGIAGSAKDIDVVLINGFGFPRWRGGLMYHADALGLRNVRDKIREFAREDPVFWAVAPLLERLAERGGSFSEL
jgi:3-hydroxyacyl-CoA dehydrogenase